MSDESTDRIDLGMKATGTPLVHGMTADGKGMGPALSVYVAAPTPPPSPPADAASSARPPKASGQ